MRYLILIHTVILISCSEKGTSMMRTDKLKSGNINYHKKWESELEKYELQSDSIFSFQGTQVTRTSTHSINYGIKIVNYNFESSSEKRLLEMNDSFPTLITFHGWFLSNFGAHQGCFQLNFYYPEYDTFNWKMTPVKAGHKNVKYAIENLADRRSKFFRDTLILDQGIAILKKDHRPNIIIY